MTERERLIEILRNPNCHSPMLCDKNCKYAHLESCYEARIADLLLANGVIVPPCKVGDIVYLFYPVRKGIYEAVVDEISLSQKSNFIVTRDLYFNRRQAIFFEQLGKTVFLTKEEAESALKERSEGK